MLGCLSAIVQMSVGLVAEFVHQGGCGFTLVVDGFAGDWVNLDVCCVIEILWPSDYRCTGGSATCCFFVRVRHLRLVLPDAQQLLCFARLGGLWH